MQRSIVAALVAMSLGACSSEDDATTNPQTVVTIPVVTNDTPAVTDNPETTGQSDGASTPNTDASGDDASPADQSSDDDGTTAGDDTATDTDNGTGDANGGSAGTDADGDTAAPQPNPGISDDAGSATSDGGQTSPEPNPGISDDAGSATSDGGQTSPEPDSGISDDAGSATSDGGQSGGESGSDASDVPPSSDDSTTQDDPTPPATTDFESDNSGGTFIRRSQLAASGQVNICTTASDQDNFSDTRVGDFILHNNAWRPWRAAPGYEWTQCIYTNTNGALAGWSYDWGPGISGIGGNPDPSGDYYVRSYPELIYGVKDEFRTSAPKSVTGLPVRMSDLPSITIDYSYNGPQYGQPRTVTASNNSRFPNGSTISGERNIAIESFLYNPDASGQCSENIVTRNGGSNHVYEVMVWLDAGAERLPAGPSDFVTDVNIRGEAFKVYTKSSDNRYVAFVAQNPQTSGSLVWNDFTDWARSYAHRVNEVFGARSNSVQIQDNWCMANIIVGTEIFWGAGNLDIFDWTITQSQ